MDFKQLDRNSTVVRNMYDIRPYKIIAKDPETGNITVEIVFGGKAHNDNFEVSGFENLKVGQYLDCIVIANRNQEGYVVSSKIYFLGATPTAFTPTDKKKRG